MLGGCGLGGAYDHINIGCSILLLTSKLWCRYWRLAGLACLVYVCWCHIPGQYSAAREPLGVEAPSLLVGWWDFYIGYWTVLVTWHALLSCGCWVWCDVLFANWMWQSVWRDCYLHCALHTCSRCYAFPLSLHFSLLLFLSPDPPRKRVDSRTASSPQIYLQRAR